MVRSRPYELIIFDWDGTLVDSPYKIVECLARAAESTGSSFDAEAGRSVIGLSLEQAIRKLYPAKSVSQINDFLLAYRTAFFASSDHSPLFAGVRDLLDWLKRDQQMDLAVATGKSRAGLDRELNEYGLHGYFTVTITAEETASKPHPMMLEEIFSVMQITPDRALMVGDTDYDLQMAELANTDAVGLACGAHDTQRLTCCSHRAILPDISHLQEWLEQLANQFEPAGGIK